MKLIMRKNGEKDGISYDIPLEGKSVADALGDWTLEARPQTQHGEIRVFLWNPHSHPDWLGRLKPAREAVLSFFHQQVTFRKGFFGRGGTLQVARSMKP